VSNDDLELDSVQVLRQDSNDKLYLAFGDSITRGVVRSDGTTAEGYEIELEALIDANLWASQVINSGKSGERTSNGVNRLVQILNTYSLDYVLLLEGTNDILNDVSYETTLYNLGIMVDYCISYNVTPIIATLPPMKIDASGSRGGYIDEIPNYYNPGIKDIASEKGITVCDQYAAFDGGWNSYSDDGIHPNEAGYSVMAQTWYDSIPKEDPPDPDPDPSSGGGGGGCFIATAAFGSSLEPNVIVLKEFRDKYLMVSGWGKRFVEFYYRTSPLIANIIANNESLKFVIRTCLYPLVGFSYLTLNSSLEQKFFVFGIFTLFVISSGLLFVRIRLRGRHDIKSC
jgi:lysophospholipase L1-like esterase